MALRFKPHPTGISGMTQAKSKGYSVVHGPYINGYEIMFPNGDVESGFTLEEANEIVTKTLSMVRRRHG